MYQNISQKKYAFCDTDPFINKIRFPLKETNSKLRIQRKKSEFRDIGHTQTARKGLGLESYKLRIPNKSLICKMLTLTKSKLQETVRNVFYKLTILRKSELHDISSQF